MYNAWNEIEITTCDQSSADNCIKPGIKLFLVYSDAIDSYTQATDYRGTSRYKQSWGYVTFLMYISFIHLKF